MLPHIHLMRIRNATEPFFNDFWLWMYRLGEKASDDEVVFPANEKISEGDHHKALSNPNYQILVGCDPEEKPVCMARYDLYDCPEVGHFGYLMYNATVKNRRSQGYGAAFFSKIAQIEINQQTAPVAMILEVQDPEEARKVSEEEYKNAWARIRFYCREPQNCVLLRGMRYIQRVEGHEGVPMLLAFKHLAGQLNPQEAFKVAQFLFGEKDVQQTGSLAFENPVSAAKPSNIK